MVSRDNPSLLSVGGIANGNHAITVATRLQIASHKSHYCPTQRPYPLLVTLSVVVVGSGSSRVEPLKDTRDKVPKGLSNPNGQWILTKSQQTLLGLITYALCHIPHSPSFCLELNQSSSLDPSPKSPSRSGGLSPLRTCLAMFFLSISRICSYIIGLCALSILGRVKCV